MKNTHLDRLPGEPPTPRAGEPVDLARHLLEAHDLVLGRPCPIPRERVEAEIAEILGLLEAPAARLRAALTFAVEALRSREEALTSLRFLRRFAFQERAEIRRIVGEALRGERAAPPRHETPMGEEDLVEGFLRYLRVEEGRAAQTAESYAQSVAVFRTFLARQRTGVREVRRDDLIAFKEELLRRGNCARTVNVRLAAIAALYRYLVLSHEVDQDPTQHVRRLPEQHRKMSVLSAAEVERLLDAIDRDGPFGERNHALVLTLFATGGRIGEVTGLRLSDVDLDHGTATFRERKNKHDNRVCLPKPAIGVLRRYVERIRPSLAKRAKPGCEDLLFLARGGGPCRRSNISRLLKRLARLVGVAKHVSTHTFRRSVATTMANNAMPAELIRTFLGHQSIATTLRNYVAYSEAAQRKAIEEYHPLSEQRWEVPGRAPKGRSRRKTA